MNPKKNRIDTSILILFRKVVLKCILFLLVSMPSIVKSQDMHFTQFYSAPMYLNPAYTGANVCSRLSATYRNQWPGVSKAYKSYLFSADHYIAKYHLGVGLLLGNDEAGTGELKTTIINPMIAYEARLGKKWTTRLGLSPGIGIKSINYSKLLFGDQIARGGSSVATVESPAVSRTYIDLSAGALLYSSKYWLGTSFFHLNRPNESLLGPGADISNLPVKYTVHGGTKIIINNAYAKDNYQKKSVTAAFNYRGQKKFDQLDIGFYYTQYVFNIGLWYRGIPLLKSYKPGFSNNDALSVIVGIQTDRLNIGYSYDFTISRLSNVSNGAHEIALSYQLCKTSAVKKKHRMPVPCPKF
jgi:type IX secretion system PorP/SprF family membrane protein